LAYTKAIFGGGFVMEKEWEREGMRKNELEGKRKE
jgi:hypothetical protein